METLMARHRKEAKELQSKVTSKMKNASKKTRKGIKDECIALEADLRTRQSKELEAFRSVPEAGGSDAERIADIRPVENLPMAMTAMRLDVNEGSQGEAETQVNAHDPAESKAVEPKKRNRQQERLARRAAKLETIANEAMEEAISLPDLRRKERERLLAEFSHRRLEEKAIAANGHCLYSAIADQLLQLHMGLDPSLKSLGGEDQPKRDLGQDDYKTIREVVANYILREPDTFLPFLEEPLASYVEKIRNTGEWGGQLELLAIANAYKINIHVLQAEGRSETISGCDTDAAGRDAWLAYYRHGFGLGEHYNSLHTTADP